MFVRIEILVPGKPGRTLKVDGPTIALGRDPASNVSFEGPESSSVSWRHAQIDVGDRGASLNDLGSSNGTFLNGQPVKASRPLTAGDVVGLGQTGPRIRIVEIATAALAKTALDKTAHDKMLPQGMLTPPAGSKPLTPTGETPRPIRRKRWPVGGLVLAASALAMVAVAGLVVFNSQNEKKKDKSSATTETAKSEAKPAESAKIEPPVDTIIPPPDVANPPPKIPDLPTPPKFEADPKVDPKETALKEALKSPIAPNPTATGSDIYRRTLQSIGWVTVPKTFPLIGTGTGALIDSERRLFLTAYHVVEGAKEAKIYFPRYDADGEPISTRDHYLQREQPIIGDVVVADPKRDLAILRLRSAPENVPALPIAAKSIGVARRVYTVGNPSASSVLWVYTEGAVRQIALKKFRMDNKQDVEAWIIEAQFPINQGDSGGPVVNDRNELVGVNCSLQSRAQLMSNCVDVREVHHVLERARQADE